MADDNIIKINEAELLAILGENGEHWVQGKWGDEQGGMCLHGAIRRCQPIPGDAYLVEQVAARQGWGPSWNDDGGTTWPMVRERLAHIEVTDADLAETFGPQWQEIVALVRRAAMLTDDEVQRLAAAWAARDAAWAARGAARDAAWAARDAAEAAAWDAAGTARYAARDAARAAVWALAVRDLIGQHGFTQAHYDTLAGAWRTVIGRIHPDDADDPAVSVVDHTSIQEATQS